jgi:hypothetical protein
MDREQLLLWLQGFLETNVDEEGKALHIPAHQAQVLKDHVAKVFVHEKLDELTIKLNDLTTKTADADVKTLVVTQPELPTWLRKNGHSNNKLRAYC